MARYLRVISVLATALAIMAWAASAVSADQVYHSERLDFTVTADGATAGHPELRHGQVVNIHPNGPVHAALEKYMVSGAMPDTSYDVVLGVALGGCAGDPLFAMVTTTIETNGAGNGRSNAGFIPEQLADLSGATLGARWLLRSGGVDAYSTECTTVVLD